MDIVLFIIIIVVASILQTSTGFGFSIMATPFLLLLFEPAEAIQINLILSLLISISLIYKIKKDINFGIMKRLIAGSFVGLPIGIWVFLWLDLQNLKLLVSLVILVLTTLLILKYRIRRSKNRDLVVGWFSGSLTASIGMPGPPLLLYFSGTDTKKDRLRGTTLAYFLFIYLVSLLVQIIFAGTSPRVWEASIIAVPLVLVGLVLGQKLFVKLNQDLFRTVTYILLIFTGLYLLFDSLF
ncbi:sulfite exporter TauE/SafE family protein [Piscibacillus salipiscarius]|uniref:Probable membrane transporter protein n=1 Tax=Piscibacillus salipiscarius TaxID=299480 RepID=A0ABW5QA94_9BACI